MTTQPNSITTGVMDKKGGMDGSVKALENALGDTDGVLIMIEEYLTGETFIRVSTARPTSEEAAPVPEAVDKQIREWGYECVGEKGCVGNYIYNKK